MSIVELPRRLGPFLLLRHLASGGMGEVYLAHQSLGVVVERLCVVKTVRPEFAESGAAIRRFLDEARTTALLSHKNVAAVLDVGEAEGTAFIAVEHVAGRDLHAVFQKSRKAKTPIPEDVVLYVIAELLDALAYVHRATDPRTGTPLNIVHRDISPHNVMVSFEGEVKLIDFGVARSAVKSDVTQTGQAVGKIRYMAPEQARAEQTDGHTDVYAACIVAIELLTGRRFYGEMSMEALWMRIAAAEPHEPQGWAKISPDLQRVFAKGLALEGKDRPSASELKEQIVAAQMKRGTLGSSDALREYLALLFEGAQEEERKARALLLHEPTSFHAAMLPSATVFEETPADDFRQIVDTDAKTDSRLDTHAMNELLKGSSSPKTMRVVREDSPEGTPPPAERTPRTGAMVPGVPPGTSTAMRRRKRRRASLAMIAGVATPMLLLLGIVIGIVVKESEPSGPPRPSGISPITVVGRAPIEVDPPKGSRIEPLPPPVQIVTVVEPAVPPIVDPVTPVTTPVTTPVDDDPKRTTTTRKTAFKKTTTTKRPKLLGDRVRALKQCSPKPTCATPVLARGSDITSLSPEEFKAFDEDVDWCLRQCR